MGGDHKAPYVVPDYKCFKVEGCEKLEKLQQALAKKGLKDPWIRNEAWRYHPGFGSVGQRARNFFFKGFAIGAALTAVTVAIEKATGGGDHHGDHHDDKHH